MEATWDMLCQYTFKNSVEYFNNALGIKKKNKLVNMLAAGKIFPGVTVIDKGLVVAGAAIEKITKKTPELVCYVEQSKFYLLQIWLCLNDKGENLIDCPRTSNCPATIYWPV